MSWKSEAERGTADEPEQSSLQRWRCISEPVFKRQSLESTAKGSPSQEERGGECNAVNLSFTWTTGTKTAMDGVEGNKEALLLLKTGAER